MELVLQEASSRAERKREARPQPGAGVRDEVPMSARVIFSKVFLDCFCGTWRDIAA